MKKILLFLATIIIGLATASYALALTPQFQVNTLSGGTLTTGLVSYWNMQGNSNDYWGTNNGTDTSVTYGTSYGKVNQGVNFVRSSSSHIKIASGSGVPIGAAARSVNLWIKTTDTTDNQFIFGMGTSAYYSQFVLYTFNGIEAFSGYGNDHAGTINIADGNWHMFTITYDGTTIKMYVDGSLNYSYNPSPNVNTTGSQISFGDFAGGTGDTVTGDIDETGMWSKVLSTNEISDLYNGGSGQTMCNGTGGPACGGKRKIITVSLNWKPEPLA